MRAVDLLAATIAGLALVLALGLRRLRAALALVLVVGAGAPLLVAISGGMQLLSGPLVLVALGVAAGLAPFVGPAGAGAALRLSFALLPLLLLPYPAWQRWAWAWALALLGLAAAARWLAPALLGALAARPPASAPPPRAWPSAPALGLCGALLAVGTWSMGHVTSVRFETSAADAVAAGDFFTPSRVAELRSVGVDAAAALTAAISDGARLAALVPDTATRIDAPGLLLLDPTQSEARLAALAAMDLPGRVELLRVALTEQGLRPDAFGEFTRALRPAQPPTPESALTGPLAGWLTSRLEPAGSGVAAVSRVHLAADLPAGLALPADLRGPAVFSHTEAGASAARLGLMLAASAWLSAFLAWIGARRLTVALAAAGAGLTAQAGALALAVAAGGVGLALLLPALLLVGALTADLAARACTADPAAGDHAVADPADRSPAAATAAEPADTGIGATAAPDRPRPAAAALGRPAVALACQVVPGLVLLATPEPAWRSFGLVVAFGGVLGFALATRAAPALCALLRRVTREDRL